MLSARVSQLAAARDQVPTETRMKWRQAFSQFDLKQNGVIDFEELTTIMKSMNMIPHPGEVEAMIAAVDHDGDNAINLDDFEMMMTSAGRGDRVGFCHVVERFIKMGDVAKLISSECTNFVDRFCREHVGEYLDLPPADQMGEHKPAWYDTFKRFTEEAELTLQNVLILWGVASQKSFDDEFLEKVEESNLLDDFLKLTDYQRFIDRMRAYADSQRSGAPLVDNSVPMHLPRPMTPHTRQKTQMRLSELDMELANLESQRNRLLAERRRLIGCEVVPVTSMCLKHELEARRYREDVGLD